MNRNLNAQLSARLAGQFERHYKKLLQDITEYGTSPPAHKAVTEKSISSPSITLYSPNDSFWVAYDTQ